MPTEQKLNEICAEIGHDVLRLFALHSERVGKIITITAITGALAACVVEAGLKRNNMIDAINSAFDDIEAQKPNEVSV